jgi:hypothetical protein
MNELVHVNVIRVSDNAEIDALCRDVLQDILLKAPNHKGGQSADE